MRRYVQRWVKDRAASAQGAFVLLALALSEAYQFDWSEETALIKFARGWLCYSRLFLLCAYPRGSQEMVFDAHEQAFCFVGGTCQRGIFDTTRGRRHALDVRFLRCVSTMNVRAGREAEGLVLGIELMSADDAVDCFPPPWER